MLRSAKPRLDDTGPPHEAASARPVTWLPIFCGTLAAAACVVLALLLGKQARYWPELGYDESAAWLGVRLFRDLSFGLDIDPAGAKRFTRGVVMDCYPPVYYIVSGLVFLIAGFGIEQARWVSILFVVGSSLACYLGAARLAGAATGLLALATSLYVPFAVYTPTSRPDIAATALSLLTLLLFAEIERQRERPALFAAAGGAYALAILSHFVAVMSGPLFLVLLLRRVGLRFWRHRGFWCFSAAWLLPILAYIALLHPHQEATLVSLINYRQVGAAGAGWTSTWPIAPILNHVAVLGGDGALLWAACGGIGSCLVALVVPSLRARLSSPLRIVVASGPVLFALMSLYPNIGVISYYAPLYLYPMSMAFALMVRAALPSQLGWPAMAAGICAGVALLSAFQGKVSQRVAAMDGVPVAAALRFLDKQAVDPQQPLLGIAHWVFASSARQIRPISLVRSPLPTDKPEFPEELRRTVPGYGPMGAVQGIVLDSWGEVSAMQFLLSRSIERPRSKYYRPELRERRDSIRSEADRHLDYLANQPNLVPVLSEMTSRALLFNSISRSGSVSLGLRGDVLNQRWPALALAAQGRVTPLRISDACVVVQKVEEEVTVRGATRVGALTKAIALMPADVGAAALIRVVVRHGNGFTALAGADTEAAAVETIVTEGLMPQMIAGGLNALRLPTGEFGRDVLVTRENLADARLIVVGAPGEVLERIELAWALKEGETCTPKAMTSLANAAAVVAKGPPPPLLRALLPVEVPARHTFKIELNAAASGAVHVWQNGKIVSRIEFQNATEIPLRIEAPGPAGFEVWIEDSFAKRRLGLLHHLRVR